MVIRARALDMTSKDDTLPFTMDMTEEAVRSMWNTGSQDHDLIVMGIYLQIVAVLRISEMVMTAEDHYIEAGSVEFDCEVDGRTKHVKTQEAHLHSIGSLRSVAFEVKSKKNDQDGTGVRYYYDIRENGAKGIDIAKEMFKFARKAKCAGREQFLSFYGGQKLSYDKYNNAIKKAAAMMGFDPKRFGTHSSRVASATIMAAAGLSEPEMQGMGGWKSMAHMKYVRKAIRSLKKAMEVITDTTIYTRAVIRKIFPGAYKGNDASIQPLSKQKRGNTKPTILASELMVLSERKRMI